MSEHTEATVTAAILKQFGSVPSQGGGRRYIGAVQVNNGAGFSFGRTLDVVVFDTWPSKGLALHGFEVKVSKSDLRRELQTPAKFREFEPFLDTFSIAAPLEVVSGERDLIPRRWGIYTPTDDGGLRTVRKPIPLHDEGHDPETCDRSFLAAFCRALVQRSLSREAEQAAFEQGKALAEKNTAYQVERAEEKSVAWRESVEEFEAKSGVAIRSYDGGRIGEAVRFVLDGGLDRQLRYIGDVRAAGEAMLALADQMDALKSSMAVERSEQA